MPEATAVRTCRPALAPSPFGRNPGSADPKTLENIQVVFPHCKFAGSSSTAHFIFPHPYWRLHIIVIWASLALIGDPVYTISLKTAASKAEWWWQLPFFSAACHYHKA